MKFHHRAPHYFFKLNNNAFELIIAQKFETNFLSPTVITSVKEFYPVIHPGNDKITLDIMTVICFVKKPLQFYFNR